MTKRPPLHIAYGRTATVNDPVVQPPVRDDGRLVATGLPPDDWCLRVATGSNGSDKGGPHG